MNDSISGTNTIVLSTFIGAMAALTLIGLLKMFKRKCKPQSKRGTEQRDGTDTNQIYGVYYTADGMEIETEMEVLDIFKYAVSMPNSPVIKYIISKLKCIIGGCPFDACELCCRCGMSTPTMRRRTWMRTLEPRTTIRFMPTIFNSK